MKTSDIIKYRSHWMGIAIIGIIIYHVGFVFDNVIYKGLHTFGYSGVDIFLFASGIGCYYSLQKDSNLYRFMQRRIIRIIPTYWIFIFIWCVYQRIYHQIWIRSIIGNFLCVQFFTGYEAFFNWYISAIWIMYFMAPFLKGYIDKYDSYIRRFFLLCVLVGLSIPFWGTPHYILAVTRIPIFYIGMCFGNVFSKNEIISRKSVVISMAAVVLGILTLIFAYSFLYKRLWGIGMNWYPFILIVPGFCTAMSFLFNYMEKNKFFRALSKGIAFIGKYSFEIFLTHVFIFHIVGCHFMKVNISQNLLWAIAVLLIAPATALLCGLRKVIYDMWIKKLINKYC